MYVHIGIGALSTMQTGPSGASNQVVYMRRMASITPASARRFSAKHPLLVDRNGPRAGQRDDWAGTREQHCLRAQCGGAHAVASARSRGDAYTPGACSVLPLMLLEDIPVEH